MKYVKISHAAKALGVHPNTLRNWARSGKIETVKTPGGQTHYAIDGILKESSGSIICYCRVSSFKQKDDLERQVEYMRGKYKDAEIVKDIGSGINFKRKGLATILDRLMRGEVITLVVAHRDRLCRFGFELFKHIVSFNGGKIVVLDEGVYSPETELTKDLLTILHVFSCRMHGLRKYKDQVKADQDLSKRSTVGNS